MLNTEYMKYMIEQNTLFLDRKGKKSEGMIMPCLEWQLCYNYLNQSPINNIDCGFALVPHILSPRNMGRIYACQTALSKKLKLWPCIHDAIMCLIEWAWVLAPRSFHLWGSLSQTSPCLSNAISRETGYMDIAWSSIQVLQAFLPICTLF